MTATLHPDRIRTRSLDLWLARGAVACVAGLQLLVVNDISLGPRWLLPALELALLVPLAAATAWNQGNARRATTDAHWAAVRHHHRLIRRMATVLTALVTVANTASLVALARAPMKCKAGHGPTLPLDAINIPGNNFILFVLRNLERRIAAPPCASTGMH